MTNSRHPARTGRWRYLALCVLMGQSASGWAASGGLDPASWLSTQGTDSDPKVPRAELREKSVYRIEGGRFLRFDTGLGPVWIPAPESGPRLAGEEGVLCEPHLRLKREVIPIRTGLPIDPAEGSLADAITALARKCRDGLIAGPVVRVEGPQGEVLEIKSRQPRAAPAQP